MRNQRKSVGLGAERSRVRNSLVPSGFSLRLALALGEGTAVQAVIGSNIWAFRRLKKTKIREMSARGYAIHSVCPQLSFYPGFSFVFDICDNLVCSLTKTRQVSRAVV